jgi:hypothetical protein
MLYEVQLEKSKRNLINFMQVESNKFSWINIKQSNKSL